MAWEGRVMALGDTTGKVEIYISSDDSIKDHFTHIIQLNEHSNGITSLQFNISSSSFTITNMNNNNNNNDDPDDSHFHYWLASSSRDHSICVFNLSKFLVKFLDKNDQNVEEKSINVNRKISSWKLIGHKGIVNKVTWNPIIPYQLLSCSHDGTVQLWDARKSKRTPLVNCRGHSSRVLDCSFSFTSQYIVFSSSEDQTCRMWDLRSQPYRSPPSTSTSSSSSIPTISTLSGGSAQLNAVEGAGGVGVAPNNNSLIEISEEGDHSTGQTTAAASSSSSSSSSSGSAGGGRKRRRKVQKIEVGTKTEKDFSSLPADNSSSSSSSSLPVTLPSSSVHFYL